MSVKTYQCIKTCVLREAIKAGTVLTDGQLRSLYYGNLPDAEFLKANFQVTGGPVEAEFDDEAWTGDHGFTSNKERRAWLIAKGITPPPRASTTELELMIEEAMAMSGEGKE